MLKEIFPQYLEDIKKAERGACGCAMCVLNALCIDLDKDVWDELPDEYRDKVITVC